MNSILPVLISLMKLLPTSLLHDDIKIIGGRATDPNEFPFVVSIGYYSKHSCGGSLVSKKHILTACHCLQYNKFGIRDEVGMKSPVSLSVTAGTVYLDEPKKGGTKRKVRSLRVHPECKRHNTGWTYDFGIVIVRKNFSLVPGKIEILPLPHYGSTKSLEQMASEVTKCQAMGWGATDEKNTSTSSRLMEVDLQLVPSENCTRLLTTVAKAHKSKLRFIKETQLCTLGVRGKDACQGDSGGPLLCDNGFGRQMIVATVSWGIGCGRLDTPGVWARLDVAETWIREMMLWSGAPIDGFVFLAYILSPVTAIITIHSTLSSCFVQQ